MTKNATNQDRQNSSPEGVGCPLWCHSHQDVDVVRPADAFRVHRSRKRRAAGCTVQLERADFWRDRRPGRIVVLLDDSELTLAQATALSSALASAVQETR